MEKHDIAGLEDVHVPAGTLIHIAGYPFVLPVDTTIRGMQVNYDLAQRAYKLTAANAHLGAPVKPGDIQPADAVAHKSLPDAEKNQGAK